MLGENIFFYFEAGINFLPQLLRTESFFGHCFTCVCIQCTVVILELLVPSACLVCFA